jgi:hypothetical protein
MKSILAAIFSVALAGNLLAMDVLTTKPESATDIRYEHAELVLKHLLKITESQYGAAQLKHATEVMSRDRALTELIKGDNIHIAAETAKAEWVSSLIPIYIPVNKGITGYRIFLISKDSQPALSKITSIEELKKIKTGSGTQWSTTKVMRTAGFDVVATTKLEGLFWMLMGDRFQTFARGINEAPSELASHQQLFPDMRIEENLALYIPLPTFFFVSPQHPKLAERIKTGLEMMLADGSFDEIFYDYHLKMIEEAKLQNRKIFPVANETLPKEVPLDIAHYWYKPGDEIEYKKRKANKGE